MEKENINTKVLADDIVAQALAQPTSEEEKRAERLAVLEATRITTATEVEPEAYSLSVDGVGFFARSDVHALKGKQKAGKSAVLKVCAAALMGGQQFRVKSELKEPVVLFLDTEQQAADVKLVIEEIRQMTTCPDDYINSHLFLFMLRRMSYDSLLADTRLLIEEYHPDVVLIDGLVDYVASFNDEVLSRQLIHELLVLCEEHRCAIVNVLHENKAADDFNMRGHLGTVLAQKAGSVLKCERQKSGVISVTCPDARHGTMPAWNIRFDRDGHIIDADLQHQQELQTAREQKAALRQAQQEQVLQERLDCALRILSANGGSMLRNDLTKQLVAQIQLDRSTVSRFITAMVKDGKLFEANKSIMSTPQTTCPF